MIRTLKIYKPSITLGDLREFVTEAQAMAVSDEETVTVRVAPTSNSPTDRGGEISIEVSSRD